MIIFYMFLKWILDKDSKYYARLGFTCSKSIQFKRLVCRFDIYIYYRVRENPVFSRVLMDFIQEKTVENLREN